MLACVSCAYYLGFPGWYTCVPAFSSWDVPCLILWERTPINEDGQIQKPYIFEQKCWLMRHKGETDLVWKCFCHLSCWCFEFLANKHQQIGSRVDIYLLLEECLLSQAIGEVCGRQHWRPGSTFHSGKGTLEVGQGESWSKEGKPTRWSGPFFFSFLLVDLPGEVNLTDWRRVLECEDSLAHVSNPLNAFQVKMMKSNVDLECGVVGWNWRCTDAI